MMKFQNDFVICDFYEVDQNEKIINKSHTSKVEKYNLKKDFIYLLNEKEAINRPWGKLYDANIIRKANIKFDESISLGEDLIFNLEYLNNFTEITFIDEGLYFYKIGNPNSLAKKYYKDMLGIQLKLKNSLLEFAEKKDLINRREIYIKGLAYLLSSVSNELHSTQKSKKKHRMKIVFGDKVIQEYIKELFEKKYINKLQYLILKIK